MEKIEDIQVEISSYILTPLSCSSLINEIIKCLIYQKCQIPYPYNWLKSTINRRRKKEIEADIIDTDVRNKGNINFTVENHFRVASKLYDDLEKAMSEMSLELQKSIVSEIIILFGPTPICPKEVCTIKVPMLAQGHFEESHINEALKHQHKALRQVFLSDIWMDFVDSTIPCTNTYIFLKKEDSDDSHMQHFKPCTPLSFQKNVKQYSISLKWESSRQYFCCHNFEVFNESSDSQATRTVMEPSGFSRQNHLWYEFEYCLQGFKNCYINKTAASQLW